MYSGTISEGKNIPPEQHEEESAMKKTFVLDTNVLLHSAQSIESFDDNEVVIPMAVIEELDKFKKNQDELGRNARHVIRKLDTLRSRGKLSEGVKLDNNPDPEKCGTLKIVSSDGDMLLKDFSMSAADNRILSVALKLMKEANGKDDKVVFITKDINLRIKADALNIPVEDFEREKVNFDELYSGFQEISVDTDILQNLYQTRVLTPPADFPELSPNEFLLLKDSANVKHSALVWFRNGKIELLPPDGVADKVWNITPRSKEQKMALQLLMDPAIQVVTLVGQAGSGKTLLALAAALEQVMQSTEYDKILVTRPIIPLGNDLGYLPGDKDEKLDAWMQPIYDNLDYLMHTEKKDTQYARRQIEELKRSHKLELEAITYIRGRSIPRQFVIVDEAQNLTPHEVKTIVSRAGEGTKMVLTGDPCQIDSPYLDASSNGLTYIAERFKQLPIHGHITLRKSERSPLAAAAAEYL